MADQKSSYSEASKHYVEVKVTESALDKERFDRSKLREAKYNENWSKQKVNINEIVDEFTPYFTVKKKELNTSLKETVTRLLLIWQEGIYE